VQRDEYQLVNIDDDGYLNLITTDGVSKTVPEGDFDKQIQSDFEAGKDLMITVVSAMGEEYAISCKEVTSK
jgi:translation initiation factor 5A